MGSEDSNNPKFVSLKKIFGYEETTRAWIEFDGKCGYCGQDLIEDRLHYSCGTIDHLIPKKDFPAGQWFQPNMILSCSLCNSLKHDTNPCDQAELETVPAEKRQDHYKKLLVEKRDQLLLTARAQIAEAGAKRHADWWTVRMILRGYEEGKK